MMRLRVEKIKLKIIFKNACQIKKNDYFCIRFEKQAQNLKQVQVKKRRHVPRHIELTAVLEEILKQTKRE